MSAKKSESFSVGAMCNKSHQLKTSAEIIKEARMSLNMCSEKGAKLIGATRRPETPAHPTRSFTFRRLLNANSLRVSSANSSISECSVESEPVTRFHKLDPLPQRPHSASSSIEKSAFRIRRRPLSVITTSVTCENAWQQLQKENRTEKNIPSLSKTTEAIITVKSEELLSLADSLSSLPCINGNDSGYFSRLSNGNLEDEIASVTSDDLSESNKSLSPVKAEKLQTCLNRLSARSQNVDCQEQMHLLNSLRDLINDEPKLSKRGHLKSIIVQTLFKVLQETPPANFASVISMLHSMNLSGQDLQMLSKLTYEFVSRKENEAYFDNETFLKSFISTVKKHHTFGGSTLLYMSGSLDSLSSVSATRKRLVDMKSMAVINGFVVALMSRDYLDVTVRLLFVMGNLLSTSDKAQWQLFQANGFVAALIKTFDIYVEEYQKLVQTAAESTEEVVDLLVKLIRVVANLSVHQAVGQILCLNEDLVLCHLRVLRIFGTTDKDELVLNTLVSLHNLSFYQVDDSQIRKRQLDVVEVVYKILISVQYNPRKTMECLNVLGNLTQQKDVCQWLFERKVHSMLVSLLDGTSTEHACSSCGVLINLSLQIATWDPSTLQEIVKKITNVLQMYKNKNWYICSLVCKLLCNLLTVTNHLMNIKEETMNELMKQVLETTDDSSDKFAVGLPMDLSRQLQDLWEDEFCPAATKLLEIISQFAKAE